METWLTGLGAFLFIMVFLVAECFITIIGAMVVSNIHNKLEHPLISFPLGFILSNSILFIIIYSIYQLGLLVEKL